MSARLGLVAIAALAIGAALLWWRARPAAHATPEAAPAPAEALEPELERLPPAASEAAPLAAREPARTAVATASAADADEATTHVTIRARFVDESGRPLAGIELSAPAIGGSAGPPTARSDGTGHAALVLDWEDLRGFSPQPCPFVMHGPGVVTRSDRQWFAAPEDRFLGEVVMQPGGSVRGRVVDPAGHGVAGATVTAIEALVHDASERAWLRTYGGWSRALPARTEPDGAFLLEGLPPQAFSIDAAAPETYHAISAPVLVHAGETASVPDLVLEPAPAGLRVAGVVRTEDGAPVEGAGIRLLDQERQIVLSEARRSDARGAFAFLVEPGKRYALQVLDHSAHGWPDVNVDGIEPGTTDLEIVFRDTHTLRVRATDAEGRPLRRFSAWITTADHKVVPGGMAASEDGAAVALRAPQAPFFVQASAAGYRTERRGPLSPADGLDDVVLALRPTTGITGRVLANERPVAGVHVDAHPEFVAGRRGLALDVFHVLMDQERVLGDVSGPEGEFFLNADRPGRYFVHALPRDGALADSGPIDFDPRGGNAEVTLELGAGGAVAGRVRVGPAARRGGLTVALSRGDGHFATALTDQDGGYRIDGLAPGAWQVAVVDPGELENARSSLRWIMPDAEPPWDLTVVAGQTTAFDLDLSDRVACVFEGRLLVDGDPPIGWTWSLPFHGRGLYQQPFDSDGRFSFELEEPGACELQLVAPRTPGFVGALRVQLELQPGPNPWERALETGTLELVGVAARAPQEQEELDPDVEPAHTLLAELFDGCTWVGYVFASADDARRVPRVPVGKIRLYDGQYARKIAGPEPAPRAEVELGAGETKVVTLD